MILNKIKKKIGAGSLISFPVDANIEGKSTRKDNSYSYIIVFDEINIFEEYPHIAKEKEKIFNIIDKLYNVNVPFIITLKDETTYYIEDGKITKQKIDEFDGVLYRTKMLSNITKNIDIFNLMELL